MFRRLLRRLLLHPMIVIAALIMFFEEWLWYRLVALMARVARAPFFRWLEARLATLPPYGAMIVFLIPGALLLPVKLLALYLMTHGHAAAGVLTIITAKVLGTAIVARLFTVCRPALLSVAWLRRLHDAILRLKERLYSAIKAMPAWATAVRWKNALKARFQRRRGALSRRWKAIGEFLKRKFSRKPPVQPDHMGERAE